MDLKERDNDYLNDTDVYFCYHPSLDNLFLSKLEYSKGHWWTIESLQYKVTTIEVQNFSELYHSKVKLKGLEYYGTIVKTLEPKNLGIRWDQGPQNKKGHANFWAELKKLEL